MIALGLQKELQSNRSISGKENRYARSKKGRKDLKIEICVGIDYGPTSCKNLKVEGDSEKVKTVETKCVRIKVRLLRKKVGEGRRDTVGWSGNKDDR